MEFLCEKCGYTTKRSYDYERHFQSKHKIWLCHSCNHNFENKEEHRTHKQICKARSASKEALGFNMHRNIMVNNSVQSSVKSDSLHFETENLNSQRNTKENVNQESSKLNSDDFDHENLEDQEARKTDRNNFELDKNQLDQIYERNQKSVLVLLDDLKTVKYPEISFTTDPKEINDFCQVYSERWKSIMSFYKLSKISRLFNCRLRGDPTP